jgi:hypothetical protein
MKGWFGMTPEDVLGLGLFICAILTGIAIILLGAFR